MTDLPLWWANAVTVVLFLLIAVAIWLIPLQRINHDAPDGARWRDIRLWATVLIAIQLVIYYLFQ